MAYDAELAKARQRELVENVEAAKQLGVLDATILSGNPMGRLARLPPDELTPPSPLTGDGLPEPTWEDPLVPSGPFKFDPNPEPPPAIPGPYGPRPFGPKPSPFQFKEFEDQPLKPEPPNRQRDEFHGPEPINPNDFLAPPINPKNSPKIQFPSTRKIPEDRIPMSRISEVLAGRHGGTTQRERESESELRKFIRQVFMEDILRRDQDQ